MRMTSSHKLAAVIAACVAVLAVCGTVLLVNGRQETVAQSEERLASAADPRETAQMLRDDEVGRERSAGGEEEEKKLKECASNLRQLATALRMYTQDYDERWPPGGNWCDGTWEYTRCEEIYQCPSLPSERGGYAMNEELSGVSLGQMRNPVLTVEGFDARGGGWNLFGDQELLDTRHQGRAMLAFVDGHVRAVKRENLNSYAWTPESDLDGSRTASRR